MVRQIALWDTTRIRFGKFASLFAFVLFSSGCVVRIGYESFLDCSLQEFFYVSRMANSIFRFLLDSCYYKLSTLCRGQLAPCLEDALPLCPFGTFPHTVGNHPRRAEPARPQLKEPITFPAMPDAEQSAVPWKAIPSARFPTIRSRSTLC